MFDVTELSNPGTRLDLVLFISAERVRAGLSVPCKQVCGPTRCGGSLLRFVKTRQRGINSDILESYRREVDTGNRRGFFFPLHAESSFTIAIFFFFFYEWSAVVYANEGD